MASVLTTVDKNSAVFIITADGIRVQAPRTFPTSARDTDLDDSMTFAESGVNLTTLRAQLLIAVNSAIVRKGGTP